MRIMAILTLYMAIGSRKPVIGTFTGGVDALSAGDGVLIILGGKLGGNVGSGTGSVMACVTKGLLGPG